MNESDLKLVKAEDCKTQRCGRGLSGGDKELLKEGMKAIKIIDNLKRQLFNEDAMIRKEEIEKANKLAEERNRRLGLIHEGLSVDEANEIIRREREVIAEAIANDKSIVKQKTVEKERDELTKEIDEWVKVMVEKRVVAGKARNVRLENGKIVSVYDDNKKTYVPYNEFLEKSKFDVEKKVGNVYPGYQRVDEELLKLPEKIEEKKVEKVEVPKITVTTTTAGSSGTGTIFSEGANIVSVPKDSDDKEKKEEKIADYKVPVIVKVDDSKVSSDRVKIINKKVHKDLIDEYIDLLYMTK